MHYNYYKLKNLILDQKATIYSFALKFLLGMQREKGREKKGEGDKYSYGRSNKLNFV